MPRKKKIDTGAKTEERREHTIVISPMKRRTMRVKVEAVTSMLMCNVEGPAIMLEQVYNLKPNPDDFSGNKKDPEYISAMKRIRTIQNEAKDPETQYARSLWLIPGTKDKFGIPAVAFKKAMMRAAKLSGNAAMTDVACAFFVCPDVGRYVMLTNKSKPQVHKDVVRQQGGTKMPTPRYRGEVSNWQATLTIEYDEDLISPESVVELVNHAGFRVGVGDKRREKGFEHGGFTVTG